VTNPQYYVVDEEAGTTQEFESWTEAVAAAKREAARAIVNGVQVGEIAIYTKTHTVSVSVDTTVRAIPGDPR